MGIHGTDRPDLLPGRVSHGCIRMRNADIRRLSRLMPVGTRGDGAVTARFALAAVLALALVPCAAASAQQADRGAPEELTEEFPLGEQLRLPSGEAVDGSAEPAQGAAEAGPPLWLFLVVPLAAAGALVALAVYARGGPPAAYGYAFNERPRPRREVSPDLLHALRPVLQYDRRRDAHVLRAVGHRLGPVLWADGEVERTLTRRFAREEPEPPEPAREREVAREG